MEVFESLGRRWGTAGIVIGAAVVAVIINLIVYVIGTLAGASFDFTMNDTQQHVNAFALVIFTAIPMLIGLGAVALLARRWPRLIPVAIAVATVLAIGTIFIMTLPADLDTASTITLAMAHVVVAIVTVAGILALRARIGSDPGRLPA